MHPWFRNLPILSLLTCCAIGAQPAAPTTPADQTEPPQPVVNGINELKGAQLLEALRRGGYVFYMRHALQIPPLPNETCDKMSLTEAGVAQARQVGAALRELKIPVSTVKSSLPCRAQDTARLMELGKVELTEDLNPIGTPRIDYVALRNKHLTQAPTPGANTMLVSHVHGARQLQDRLQLEIAEIVVFKPDGKGGAEPVARIQLHDWHELIKLAR
jgi:phosphohistidine phosphatase SixA